MKGMRYKLCYFSKTIEMIKLIFKKDTQTKKKQIRNHRPVGIFL